MKFSFAVIGGLLFGFFPCYLSFFVLVFVRPTQSETCNLLSGGTGTIYEEAQLCVAVHSGISSDRNDLCKEFHQSGYIPWLLDSNHTEFMRTKIGGNTYIGIHGYGYFPDGDVGGVTWTKYATGGSAPYLPWESSDPDYFVYESGRIRRCVLLRTNGEMFNWECDYTYNFFCAYPLSNCSEIRNDDSSVCSGNGYCSSETCNCDSGYVHENCQHPECFGIPSNYSSTVCSGYGDCVSPDNCTCDVGYYSSNCSEWSCYDINKSSATVCSSNGSCIAPNNCSCQAGFYGDDCSQWDCSNITFSTESVCFSKGRCISPGNCSCNDGYYTADCSQWDCYSINKENTSDVCSGHGSCLSPNVCFCQGGYASEKCQHPVCFGYTSNDTSNVCSGVGACVTPDVCDCAAGRGFASYTHEQCQTPLCYEIAANSSSVCSGGVCHSPNNCTCIEGYYDEDCVLCQDGYYCPGGQNTSMINCDEGFYCKDGLKNICGAGAFSGEGINIECTNCSSGTFSGLTGMTSQDNCSICPIASYCPSGSVVPIPCPMGTYSDEYGGQNLSQCLACPYGYFCPINSSSNEIQLCNCSGNGNCTTSINDCHCEHGYYMSDCQYFNCHDIVYYDDSVCSYNGSCVSPDNCSCSEGFYSEKCEEWECFGVNRNYSDVCHRNGDCILPNVCVCYDGFTHAQCQHPICYQIPSNYSGVCSGRGNCTNPNQCECFHPYFGDNCQYFNCSMKRNDALSTCGGGTQGICMSPDNCSCLNGYYGVECEKWNCSTKFYNDSSVCMSNGVCISPDNCSCESGYYGNDCRYWNCLGVEHGESSVCSSRGNCSSPEYCECEDGYTHENCQHFVCFGEASNETEVCSNSGSCIAPNLCNCTSGYGVNCIQCEPGYQCKGGMNSSLELCDIGFYCQNGDTVPCTAGTYNFEKRVSVSCNNCPNGTFSNITGSISVNNCSVCGVGVYCIGGSVHVCPSGFYCPTKSAQPIPCPNGTYSSTEGNEDFSKCLDCPDGFFCPQNSSSYYECNCSKKGSCYLSENDCHCFEGYSGSHCEKWKCFGTFSTASTVCNNEGTCSSYNNCSCNSGFYSNECDVWDCFGVSRGESGVCSSHGECLDPNDCSCVDPYVGVNCDGVKDDVIDENVGNFSIQGGDFVYDEEDNNNLKILFDKQTVDKREFTTNWMKRGKKVFKFKLKFYSLQNYDISNVFVILKEKIQTNRREDETDDTVLKEINPNNYTGEVEMEVEYNSGNDHKVSINQEVNSNNTIPFYLSGVEIRNAQEKEDEGRSFLELALVLSGVTFFSVISGCIAIICCFCISLCFCFIFVNKRKRNKIAPRYYPKRELSFKINPLSLVNEEDDDHDQCLSKLRNVQTEVKKRREDRKKQELAEIKIDYQRIHFVKVVGSGGYGDVFLVKLDRKKFALKTLCKMDKSTVKEIRIMKRLVHPNIVSIKGYTLNETGKYCIMMEYVKGGTLQELLYDKEKREKCFSKKLSWVEKYRILKKMVCSLNYLHSEKRCVHRDIKSGNVLLSKDLSEIKLCDFGIAKMTLDTVMTQTGGGVKGSVRWLAPEIENAKSLDDLMRTDIYSFAMLVYELAVEKIPFKEIQNDIEVRMSVKIYKKRPKIPVTIPKVFSDIIKNCWQDDPMKRMNAYQLLNFVFDEEGKFYDTYVKDKNKIMKELIGMIKKLKEKVEICEEDQISKIYEDIMEIVRNFEIISPRNAFCHIKGIVEEEIFTTLGTSSILKIVRLLERFAELSLIMNIKDQGLIRSSFQEDVLKLVRELKELMKDDDISYELTCLKECVNNLKTNEKGVKIVLGCLFNVKNILNLVDTLRTQIEKIPHKFWLVQLIGLRKLSFKSMNSKVYFKNFLNIVLKKKLNKNLLFGLLDIFMELFFHGNAEIMNDIVEERNIFEFFIQFLIKKRFFTSKKLKKKTFNVVRKIKSTTKNEAILQSIGVFEREFRVTKP